MPEEFKYIHTELSVERINYWEDKAGKFLEEYGKEFREFTEDLGSLTRRGNYQLQRFGATGYNILRSSRDMDLQSSNMLLFYNNSITSSHHFGLLLGELEHDGLTREDEVSFGVKASAVLVKPEDIWIPDPEKAKVRTLTRKNRQGEIETLQVQDSLELVLTIKVRNEAHAQALVEFFDKRTFGDKEGAIEDSWEVPDIRATDNLSDYLQRSQAKYRRVVANMSHMGYAQLIVLRLASIIRKQKHSHISVNELLAKYLVWYDVPE